MQCKRFVLNSHEIMFNAILVLLIVSFFSTIDRMEVYMLIAVMAFYFALYSHGGSRIIIEKVWRRILLLIIVSSALQVIFSDFMPIYMLVRFAFLLLLELLFEQKNFIEIGLHREEKWFYWVLLLLVLYSLYNYSGDSAIKFVSIGDHNYTGVLMLFLFMYSFKNRRILGIAASIFYAVFYNKGRSFFVVLLLFFLIEAIIKLKNKFKHNMKQTYMKFGVLFVLMFIGTVVVSYIWVYHIAAGGVTEYHSSLNDTSNQLRFTANIKGLELLSDFRNSFLWGLGNDLKKVLHINTEYDAMHTYFLGVRLEQPHNSILNLLIRMGIVPGIAYFLILSRILNRKNEESNYPYIFPYLLNGMIMHSLFEGIWLVFWVVILYIPSAKRRWKL